MKGVKSMGSVSFDSKGIILDGKHVVIISGEFHYFRVVRDEWEERIRAMKMANCNALSTYVPWNYHEPEEGVFCWEGDRDLGYLLELCERYELYVIIKPGPFIGAEWDFGGYPHWLLPKGLTLRAADDEYLRLTGCWFKSVGEVIRPHLYTNDGSIILVQVENEYDHLVRGMPEITGSAEDAKNYILELLALAREGGIDVPAFTNDGTCIYGTEIINTSTYYPIALGLWRWMFDYYDGLLTDIQKQQPNMPLIIIEAQSGWFLQAGSGEYELDLAHAEAVPKALSSLGASVINYYMFSGGTNFPYWGSIGDYYFGHRGITTSYDYSGAPIREWGEIHERFHILKTHAHFLQSFPELINHPEACSEPIGTQLLEEKHAIIDTSGETISAEWENTRQNFRTMLRRSPKISAALVRNHDGKSKKLTLSHDSRVAGASITFPAKAPLQCTNEKTMLLPIDVEITNDASIVYSTSEIALRADIGAETIVFLYGDEGTNGELLLKTSRECKPTSNAAEVEKTQHGTLISYTHGVPFRVNAGDVAFIVMTTKMARRLYRGDNAVLLTNHYFIEKIDDSDGAIAISMKVRSRERSRTWLWTAEKPDAIVFDGKPAAIERDPITGATLFESAGEGQCPARADWIGEWRYCPDSQERLADYDDSSWGDIDASTPLEKAGYFEHGYYWYRSSFDIDGEFSDVELDLRTNGLDFYQIWINGVLFQSNRTPRKFPVGEAVKKGRNVISILYLTFAHPKAHPHEGPVQKFSGLYEPVTVTGKVNGADYEYRIPSWKIRFGLSGHELEWYHESFNDKKWRSLPAVDRYLFEPELGTMVWLRRSFEYTPAQGWDSPLYIEISEMKERGLLYVNGHLIGKYENVGPQRRFYVPRKFLKSGPNQCTILMNCPGFHDRYVMGYYPGIMRAPSLGFYHQAKQVEVLVK